ncbi:protein transporter tim10 [Mycoemilia scoparia]|uniref:Mitochondrial import inner membrane translocase subunit n=1 Tax=Mycoemilia scoparia TaxID=417184 RepID=A0A9W7ZSD0_9FUNG|nr:protein transporter tim10 [Mycoemilia scoparia]
MFGLFGGGNSNNKTQQPQAPVGGMPGGFGGMGAAGAGMDPQMQYAAAEQELEMVTDMFTRLGDACHKKCILQKYNDEELTKGESVCLDRCVSKFFQVNKEVSDKLTKLSQLSASA